MKSSINNIIELNKLPLIIAIIMPVIIMSMNSYFNDVGKTLLILIIFFILTCLLIVMILQPFWAMMLLIIYLPYSGLINIPIIDSVQRVFFIIVVIGWFLKYFQRGESVVFDFIKSNKIIMLFILSMLLSSILAFKPISSFKMSFQIMTYIFMAFIMQDLINDKKRLNILIIVIVVNIGIVVLFNISDYLVTGLTNEHGGTIRYGSLYGHANHLAKVLVFGIPFVAFLALDTRNIFFKSLCLLVLLASIFSLGLTLSRSFMLAFAVYVVAFLGLCLKNRTLSMKRFIVILLIIFFISSLIFNLLIDNIMERASYDVSVETRQDILLKGIDLFKKNPFFGIGLKNLQYADNYNHKYNLLVQGRDGHEIISSVFVSIGMFGSLSLIVLFYIMLKWLNEAVKYQSIQNEKCLLNFIISLQAGYIALLSSAIGTDIIFGIEFWIYYALSGIVLRLSLRDMSVTEHKAFV